MNKRLTLLFFILCTAGGCILPAPSSQPGPPLSTLYAQFQQTLTPGLGSPAVTRITTVTPEPPVNLPGSTPDESEQVFLHTGLPQALLAAISLERYRLLSEPEDSSGKIILGPVADQNPDAAIWTYALAAPFFTIEDDVSFENLQALWQGAPLQEETFTEILVSASTRSALTTILGAPDPTIVKSVAWETLLDESLSRRSILAILPFEELKPQFKLMRVDGSSPLDQDFDPLDYPLSIQIWAEGPWGVAPPALPSGNYDPNLKTILVMTGVTALTRATAYQMALRGETFPGLDIRSWLMDADLVHISHEVPFAENCPDPDPVQEDLIFCASPERIALFEDIGADIIELTGNHLLDYGEAAAALTLQMYRDRGWLTYAGGLNLSEAQAPAKVTHNGNNLAFIGCNLAGPPNVWANDAKPGAASCGDYRWMETAIQQVLSEGYLPIVTLQYFEDYSAIPSPQMMSDFLLLAEAGAAVINGSQAHTPKIMGFHDNSFLHFGLGNLFFDQMAVYYQDILMEGTRDEFLNRLVFYNNQLVSIELLTAKLEDYARPRPMTLHERENFLSRIFDAASDHPIERIP